MLSAIRIITSLSNGARRRKVMPVCGSVRRRVFIWASVVEIEITVSPAEAVEGSALGSVLQYWA